MKNGREERRRDSYRVLLSACSGYEQAEKCGIAACPSKEIYEAIFYGTNADIYVPLWASACTDQGKILLNQTTLEVICFYKRYGYAFVKIDHQPADFVGEMFRFLLYLKEGILGAKEREETEEQARLEITREQFRQRYLFPTLEAMDAAVKVQLSAEAGVWMNTIRQIAESEACAAKVGSVQEVRLDDQTEKLCKEVRKGGTFPAIPVEEAREVLTAGLNNCGGKCVICPTVQEGCLLRIETDTSDRHPQIKACSRGHAYRKTFLHAERLKYPMKRIGERGEGRFERISWEEAAEIISREWIRIRDIYGPASRYMMYGAGVTGELRPSKMAKRLLSLDGGYLDYYNSYSSACANYITPYIYGRVKAGNSFSDVLNTNYLILWGHNPAETIFGTETNVYLAKLKRKGVPIVVIDPRCSNTAAQQGMTWIPIRPGTDSALADGMAYVIWSEGLQDQHFLDIYCVGFDEAHLPAGAPANASYESYLSGVSDGVPKTPEWAEAICGVPAEQIRQIARDYAKAKPGCLLTGLGLQRTRSGEQAIRSTALLCCMTGNVGIPGGGAGAAVSFGNHRTVPFPEPKNPFPGQIPVFLWTKAIEHATEMDFLTDGVKGVDRLPCNLKMLFSLAGNTLINQHSDIRDTERILKDTSKCEFIVVSDIFMTPSARYADVLLPAPSVFETSNLTAPWRGSNFFLCNNQVIDPIFDCRFEWEWLKEVAKHLGLYEKFTEGEPDLSVWMRRLYEENRKLEPLLPDYETFRREGGFQYPEEQIVAFSEEIAHPDTVPFSTPSGKIEIYSEQLAKLGLIPPIPCYTPVVEGVEDPLREKYPLQLIGYHTIRRCHSVHDNNDWLEELDPTRLWIHPDDAFNRNVVDGNVVEVYNDRGCVRLKAFVTNRIMKGVIAMSQGGWYKKAADGADIGGSINVLTTAKHPSPLAKGNPQHTNLAEVRLVRTETGEIL